LAQAILVQVIFAQVILAQFYTLPEIVVLAGLFSLLQ